MLDRGQNASSVCPESVRPLRSVIVTEAITGSLTAAVVKQSSMAKGRP